MDRVIGEEEYIIMTLLKINFHVLMTYRKHITSHIFILPLFMKQL